MRTMNKGLVVANGALTSEEWGRLAHGRQLAWLARLDDHQVAAQASVLAASGRLSLYVVLLAWLADGLLCYERVRAALTVAELRGRAA